MDIPGTKSQALAKRRHRVIPRGLASATPIYVDKAEGTVVWDVDGNQYLDFAGGIGVQNLGHRSPLIVDAMAKQLNRFIHTSINVLPYDLYVEAAEKLVAIVPGPPDKKVLFTNSGAEAVENAIKIARTATKRHAIVAFTYGFHGRTLLTMTLTGKTKPYRAGFGPMAPEIYHIPYPYSYRDPLGMSPRFGRQAADRLLDLFATEIAAEEVAAVIVEPVAGEGGFIVPPMDFLPRLREITAAHGILLIADEIQTGFGRTGTLFAIEQSGIEPDLMTLGKSLAAGMPLAAVVGISKIMDAPEPGGLGGTYAGNPVALAACLSVLKEWESPETLLRGAREIGDRVQRRFQDFHARLDIVGEVRGLGAMAALELVCSKNTPHPCGAVANLTAQYAYEHGLILMRAGMDSHVIRTLMPLTIRSEELDRGLAILDDALSYASQEIPDHSHDG